MHRSVSQNDESPAEDREAHAIDPERLYIETKTAQDSGARDLKFEAVLLVDKRKVLDLVYDQAFKPIVEDG